MMSGTAYTSYEVELLELITRKYQKELEKEIGISINNNLDLIRNEEKDESIISLQITGHKALEYKDFKKIENISKEDIRFEISMVYKLEILGTKELSDEKLKELSKNIIYPTIKHTTGEMMIKLNIPVFPFPKKALGID